MRFFLLFLLLPSIALAVATYSATDSQQMYVSGSDLVSVEPSFPLRAFPNAEGLAALTRGASDPVCDGTRTLYTVTNTNNSGAGSFRDAVEGVGKDCRYVIFKTSGIIDLDTPVYITSNYQTIAGQTSPSGITFTGNMISVGDDNYAGYHDIIIRHIRSRPGYHSVASQDLSEAFRCWSCYNVMVDQSSFSWAGDEVASVTTHSETAPAYNVTFSRCLFSEGLSDTDVPNEGAEHAFGLLFNGSAGTAGINSMDVHGTVFAHFNNRTPQLSGAGEFTLANNINYNAFKTQGTMLVATTARAGEMSVNFIDNLDIPGANSWAAIGAGGTRSEITLSSDSSSVTPWPMLYVLDNYGSTRDAENDTQWMLSNWWLGTFSPTSWQSNSQFITTEGVPITRSNLTAATMTSRRDAILADAGATKPVRDSHDTQMVLDVQNGTGNIITNASLTYPDDWPVHGSDPYPTDTDNDGMSDVWETDNGLNVGINDALLDLDNDGYLNIEEYTHYLAGDI